MGRQAKDGVCTVAEFEEKLNALLSSPESMQQVAQLAQMLSQSQGDAPPPPPESSAAPDLSALTGGMDLSTLSRFLPLLQELNGSQNDERARLLHALKPFLRPERQEKVDTALRLARLLRVGKQFFKGFGEHHV